MGLGSFRVRLVAALLMLLVVWQSVRIWSPSMRDADEDYKESQVKEDGDTQRVLIGVYYEALCPDSRSFVVTQLEPTARALHGHVTVQMIPFGKAKMWDNDDGYKFSCQHGPLECEANIIHACAIDILKEPILQLEFLTCMIKNNLNPQNITKTCAEKMHVDPEPILNCAKGPEGKELFVEYGKMTFSLRPKVEFIPTVTLDKSSDDQLAILKNLLKETCKHFKVPPKACPN